MVGWSLGRPKYFFGVYCIVNGGDLGCGTENGLVGKAVLQLLSEYGSDGARGVLVTAHDCGCRDWERKMGLRASAEERQ